MVFPNNFDLISIQNLSFNWKLPPIKAETIEVNAIDGKGSSQVIV